MRRAWITALTMFAACTGAVGNGDVLPWGLDGGSFDARVQPVEGPPASDGLSNTKLPLDAGYGGARCNGELPAARGLRIRQLALYQTVKVPLYEAGQWVAQRVAPVVQGKKALVRVFVDTLPEYQPHGVRAVLRLVNDGVGQQLIDERALPGASSDPQLASTFNFQVQPALLGANTQIALSLLDSDCNAPAGVLADTQLSAEPVYAAAINTLKVTIVPVNLNGRLPLLSDKELSAMRAAMLAFYPVPDVELSIRAALVWNRNLDALAGDGWSDLLNQIMRERAADAPADNVYYFGLVQPGTNLGSYCQTGCMLGLAPQTKTVMPSAQVALGSSFADYQTYETMVHELGHAHGLGHTPCAEGGKIDGIDPNFPDPGGATLDWGWDNRSNSVMPPADKDIMGYCKPVWIGAYNYNALARRSMAVNLQVAASRRALRSTWRSVLLYEDGRARWADTVGEEPAGDVLRADVLDASSAWIDQVDVVRVALSHGGAILYVPPPGARWSTLRIGDRDLQLSEILPPR